MSEQPTRSCPVPQEQLPINEYQELKQSWFFSWVTLPWGPFIRKLLWVWGGSLLICAPIAAASFPPSRQTLSFLVATSLGGCLFVAFVLIRLYLGWRYVGERLVKTKIVYEESSWYDGQVWEKPVELHYRDKLIFQHQVLPLLKKLEKTGWALLSFMVLLVVTLFVSRSLQ